MRDEQLEALAQRIRDLWVAEYRDFELRTKGKATNWGSRHMPQWDGGETEDGKIHKPVWPKIARLCIENDLEPDILVRSLFYRRVDYPPTPNMATKVYALEKYQEYTAPGTRMEMKTELIHRFESQKQRALADVFSKKTYYKLDEQTAWRITLKSKASPLTPLFRYCVAKNQGWADIAADNEAKAAAQYRRFAELYDEVWGDWIPADFKVAALAKKGVYHAERPGNPT